MNSILRVLLLLSALCALVTTGCLSKHNPSSNQQQALPDTDGDGIPNISDPDIDNDGILNARDPDMDGDGTPNISDPDIDGDKVANIDDNDIDGDGVPNVSDADLDGDGVPNVSDSDIDGDGIANINDNDIDGDGISNAADPDLDGDGTPNASDPDLDNDGVANASDQDIDGDGIVNAQDPDMDGDGTPNATDPTPDGTGNGSSGTQGPANTGADVNTGTTNTGADVNTGANTDNSGQTSGVVVEASHEESVDLKIVKTAAGSIIDSTVRVELADVRKEIADEDIDLPSAYVKSVRVAVGTSSLPYVQANASKRIVVKLYFQQPGKPGTRELIMQSPDASSVFPPITLGALQTGISTNKGLYVAMPGYDNYINAIKDKSQSAVELVVQVELLDALTGPGTLNLTVSTVLAGKKAL